MIFHFSDKLVKKLEKEGIPLFESIQNSLFSSIIFWVIDSKYRQSVRLSRWIKKQVVNPSDRLKKYAKNIETKKNYDLQAIAVLKWVRTALTYVGDTKTWGRKEHWNTTEETLDTFKGDCEDGAILAYVLCRLKGIPANRLLIAAGSVRGGGHAWLAYKPRNYPYNFSFLDWCYWYSSKSIKTRSLFSINLKHIEEYKGSGKARFKKMSNYLKIWFMFNEEKAHPRIEYDRR